MSMDCVSGRCRVGLPGVGLEGGVGEVVRGGREGADADDGAADVAGEAVGELLEGVLLGDGGLDLRAQQPMAIQSA